MQAMTTVSAAEGWTRELDALAARIAPRFARAEPRRPALASRPGLPARRDGGRRGRGAGALGGPVRASRRPGGAAAAGPGLPARPAGALGAQERLAAGRGRRGAGGGGGGGVPAGAARGGAG